LIKKYTAESQQVTDALAKNLSMLIKADVYGAITGLNAGGGSENQIEACGNCILFTSLQRKINQRKNGVQRLSA